MVKEAKPTTSREGRQRRYWLDEPRNVDKIFYALVGLCAATALADLFYHKHTVYAIEEWFAFYGLFGFVACVGLVLAAKELRKILKRDEDYYKDD